MYVCVEGVEPMLSIGTGDLGNSVLIPMVANESVELTAEIVQVLLDDGLSFTLLGQVRGKELELA